VWEQSIKQGANPGQARERLHDSVTEVLRAAEAMLSGFKEDKRRRGDGPEGPRGMVAQPAVEGGPGEKKGTFKLFGKEVSSGVGASGGGIARPLEMPQERQGGAGLGRGPAVVGNVQQPRASGTPYPLPPAGFPPLDARGQPYPFFGPASQMPGSFSNGRYSLPMLWN
jgi:hypothetical protein